MIGIQKLAKILSFITKEPYLPSLLNTVTCLLYSDQQGLEANQDMDDGNIETSKDP